MPWGYTAKKDAASCESDGEKHTFYDPSVSEWGNPARVMPGHCALKQLGVQSYTLGTEPSKYQQENKSIEIP
jgi:hypothetical protein